MAKVESGNWFEVPWQPVRRGITRTIFAMGSDKVTCAIGACENGHELNPHSHPYEQIAICVEGQFDFYADGVCHKMKKGSWVLVPPNVVHYAETYESDVPALGLDIFVPSRPAYVEEYRQFLKDHGITEEEEA